MKRLRRVRRGEAFTVEERLNEMVDGVNDALALQAGPGIEIKHTPAGLTISLAPSMRKPQEGLSGRFSRVFFQTEEPDAALMRAGDIWIDSDETHDGINQGLMKTDDSTEDNDSMVPFLLYQTL